MELKPVYRHEDKYLINYLQYVRLKQMISAVMHPDIYSVNEHGYPIRSLYYDTPSNRDFHEKDDGVDLRQKLRLRIYQPAAKYAKLEIKHRQEGGIYKESINLTHEEAQHLLKADIDPSFLLAHSESAAAHLYRLFQADGYLPVVIIDYDREAFTLPFYQIRVTFDRCIRAGRGFDRFFDPKLLLTPVLPSDEIVLEVKYNYMFPSFFKPIIGIAEGQAMSISKYYQARLMLG